MSALLAITFASSLATGDAHAQRTRLATPAGQAALATIDPDEQTIAAGPKGVTVDSFPYGGTVSIDLTRSRAAGELDLAVLMPADESLTTLADGEAAVTAPLAQAPDVGDAATDQTDPALADTNAEASAAAAANAAPDTDAEPRGRSELEQRHDGISGWERRRPRDRRDHARRQCTPASGHGGRRDGNHGHPKCKMQTERRSLQRSQSRHPD